MIELPHLWQFVALLTAHWIGDFICQTHWQASNKSKDMEALLRHVGSYTLVLTVAALILFGGTIYAAAFVAVNAALHFGTDYLTSRWTSKLWAKQDWHNFFVVIGFDQLIHQITLAVTFALLIGGTR